MAIQDRRCMILYTTAVCNLNCVYCFIDKNSALQTIDQYLDDSFIKTPDYYFDFAKRMFYKDKLEEMQFWGGEPFLAIHRAYHTIEKCINFFPNLKIFMASTNFAHDTFFDEFYGILDILKQYPSRKFSFKLQMSIDGPEEINDSNRGKNVTQTFIKNFKKFVIELQDILPENVSLGLHMKPTLDSESIKKLQNKDSVYNYFHFFEGFHDFFRKNNKKKNLTISLPIPNTACPSPHTKADGIRFANYCKLCRELSEENKTTHIFKYYKNILSFHNKKAIINSNCIGFCQNGVKSLGLLPNNMVSCCHNGFVNLIADYKKKVQEDSTHMATVTIEKGLFTGKRNSLIFNADSPEFETHQKKIEYFNHKDNTAKMINMVSLLRLLAMTGQVDIKYADYKEAIAGIQYITNSTAYCVRDNLGVTGSLYLYPVGLLKLLLNGAREEIEKWEQENDRK